MALSNEFKRAISGQNPVLCDDNVIEVKSNTGYSFSTVFNFMTRIVSLPGKDGKMAAMPFSQMDREVLENIREYMIEQGKKPLPLPAAENNPGLNFAKDFSGGIK